MIASDENGDPSDETNPYRERAYTSHHLRTQIIHHLDVDSPETANFLAGRFHAYAPRDPESAHLLALTCLRLRRFRAAADASQKFSNGRHLGCTYVYAQACLRLGRFQDGIKSLEKTKMLWKDRQHVAPPYYHLSTQMDPFRPQQQKYFPDASDVYTLLGKLCVAHGDSKKAAEHFVAAHGLNPFAWEAFEGLCQVGADLKVENMFKVKDKIEADRNRVVSAMTSAKEPSTTEIYTDEVDEVQEDGTQGPPLNFNQQSSMPSADPFGTTKSETASQTTTHLRKPSINLHKRTISGHSAAINDAAASAAPARRSNRLIFGQSASSVNSTGSSRPPTAEALSSLPTVGRPAKPATGTRGRITNTVGRVVSGNRKILPAERKEKDEKGAIAAKRAPSRTGTAKSTTTSTTAARQRADPDPQRHENPQTFEEIVTWDAVAQFDDLMVLLSLLRTLAIGTYATTRFDTNLALKTFRSLPAAQRETPYVLSQLGCAHYEATNYTEAAESFARCLKLEPSKVKDMEVYSTVLWHLKNEAGLAFLCLNLRETTSNEPQTWVAVGNAFSLSREHDSAIAAFRRAVQIDSKFAYAWTLMGHEHIANEDFDAALSCFRHAVAYDRRGFGGWYGLGKCFERVGKLEDAERHYRIASSINPSNATLLVCIGVVLEKQRNRQAALSHYTKALELDPTSALARFKKARVQMALRCFEEALEDLEILRGVAGEEANVWFLLGKCYKGLGMPSVNAFTKAIGLDVKAAPLIKEAMEAEDDEDSDYD